MPGVQPRDDAVCFAKCSFALRLIPITFITKTTLQVAAPSLSLVDTSHPFHRLSQWPWCGRSSPCYHWTCVWFTLLWWLHGGRKLSPSSNSEFAAEVRVLETVLSANISYRLQCRWSLLTTSMTLCLAYSCSVARWDLLHNRVDTDRERKQRWRNTGSNRVS